MHFDLVKMRAKSNFFEIHRDRKSKIEVEIRAKGNFFEIHGDRKRSTQVLDLVLGNLGLQKVGRTSKTIKTGQNIEKSKNI